MTTDVCWQQQETRVPAPVPINERFCDAFNAGDLDTILALYERDAIVIPAPDAPPRHGLIEIEDVVRSLFAVGGTLSFTPRNCLVNREWALLTADWTLAGGRVGRSPVDVNASSSALVHRVGDGEWKYVIDHRFAIVESARTRG